MLFEIHTNYIETVASILLDEFGTDLEELRRSGSTIFYRVINEDIKNNLDSWCSSASGCSLIYQHKFSYAK